MYRGGLFSIIIHIETDVRTIVKGGVFMDNKYVKIHTTGCNAPLKVTPGHFATNHAHINYYLDMTTLNQAQRGPGDSKEPVGAVPL